MAQETRTPPPNSTALGRMTGLFAMPDGTIEPGIVSKLRDFCDRLALKINGYLSLGTVAHAAWAGNLDAQFLQFTPTVANTSIQIPHGLGRVPQGYIVVRTVGSGVSIVWDAGGGGWTESDIYLCATATGVTFWIMIF